MFGRVFEVKYFQYTLFASLWDKLPRSSTDSLTLQLDLDDSNDFFPFFQPQPFPRSVFSSLISSLDTLKLVGHRAQVGYRTGSRNLH